MSTANVFFCTQKRCVGAAEKGENTRLEIVKTWKTLGRGGNFMVTAQLRCPRCKKGYRKCIDSGRAEK